jgi:hypothetical protein
MGKCVMILPGTGKGTATRSGVVEGAHVGTVVHPFDPNCSAQTWAPSTSYAGPPPRAGEDLA